MLTPLCVSYVVCVVRRVCRTSCVLYVVCVVRRVCLCVVRFGCHPSLCHTSFVFLCTPHIFLRTSWASGFSFWFGLRSPLIFRTPPPVYVHRREFPVLLELDADSLWASISHLRPGGRLVLRAPRLFSCVLCIGGDYSLRLLRGASSLVHWGGPISRLTRTRSSERRFVCLLFIAALLSLGCLMSELGTAGQAVCFRRLSIEDPRSFVPSHSTPHRAYFERSCATRRCVD